MNPGSPGTAAEPGGALSPQSGRSASNGGAAALAEATHMAMVVAVRIDGLDQLSLQARLQAATLHALSCAPCLSCTTMPAVWRRWRSCHATRQRMVIGPLAESAAHLLRADAAR
jgi:hypothetical protein